MFPGALVISLGRIEGQRAPKWEKSHRSGVGSWQARHSHLYNVKGDSENFEEALGTVWGR